MRKLIAGILILTAVVLVGWWVYSQYSTPYKRPTKVDSRETEQGIVYEIDIPIDTWVATDLWAGEWEHITAWSDQPFTVSLDGDKRDSVYDGDQKKFVVVFTTTDNHAYREGKIPIFRNLVRVNNRAKIYLYGSAKHITLQTERLSDEAQVGAQKLREAAK